jgi:hypothetical protein
MLRLPVGTLLNRYDAFQHVSPAAHAPDTTFLRFDSCGRDTSARQRRNPIAPSNLHRLPAAAVQSSLLRGGDGHNPTASTHRQLERSPTATNLGTNIQGTTSLEDDSTS